MTDPDTAKAVDAARTALLALDRAQPRADAQFLEPEVALDAGAELDAIHLLDEAGAIEAALDADYLGNTRWRVRALTLAGREVARLVADDRVWRRLRDDLRPRGNPFAILVGRYRDAVDLAPAP
jgi:hypothetical protein